MHLRASIATRTITALILTGCLFGPTRIGALVSAAMRNPPAATAELQPACPAAEEVTATLGMASRLMAQARYAQAIPLLTPLNEASCDSRVPLLLAAAYEGSDDLPHAIETLQGAHETWKTDDHIAASLARLYFGMHKPDQAAQALTTFHATASTPMQEINVAVVVFLETQQLRRAEETAQIGYESHPSLASVLLLANTLQLEGRYKDVIALLDGARSAYAQAAPFLVTLAQSEYDASMFDVARSDGERAVAIDPKLYAAHYLLGNVFEKTGAPEKAIGEYRSAIQISPDQPRTYYYLALALRAEHKEQDEEEVLAKAVAIDAHYALARCELGRILLDQDRIPEAISQLNMAVEENASNEQGYYLLAKAYQRAGNKDQAEAMARRYAEVNKANHSQGARHNTN